MVGYKARRSIFLWYGKAHLRYAMMICTLSFLLTLSAQTYDQNQQAPDPDSFSSATSTDTTNTTSSSDPKASDKWTVGDEASDPLVSDVEAATISDTPIVNLPADLSLSIDRQFENILRLEEELEAFDQRLGESYYAYASSLAKAGRIDEARDMYAKVLHLSKINNGVYSLEQRPILRKMFEIHHLTGDVEEMEAALSQIVWLEKKNPEIKDRYSYDLVLKMAGSYIDLYYEKPRQDESSLDRVQKAIKHLSYAVRRYNINLEDEQQPYGDLAFLHYISSQINIELGRVYRDDFRNRGYSPLERPKVLLPSSNYFGRADLALRRYLTKAKVQNSVEHQVRALRDLGDLNLLYGRIIYAAEFYKLSWEAAAELDDDHVLVLAFTKPAQIPEFTYSQVGRGGKADDRSAYVPVNFDLLSSGRVKKVNTELSESQYPKLAVRARRSAKNLIFRPVIENGKMIASNDVIDEVRVRLRKDEYIAKSELDE